MKRLPLAVFAVASMTGCAALSEAFKPGPDGTVPAQTTTEAVGSAVMATNPAVGGVLLGVGGIIGAVFGRKTSPTKPAATPPAV